MAYHIRGNIGYSAGPHYISGALSPRIHWQRSVATRVNLSGDPVGRRRITAQHISALSIRGGFSRRTGVVMARDARTKTDDDADVVWCETAVMLDVKAAD